MARLDVEQWAAIRREWEEGPLVSYRQLAEAHGVDRTNISRKADKEGWQKKTSLTIINAAAQRKADSRVDSEGNEKRYERRRTDLPQSTEQQSEDLRAEVLTRHRKEWAELEGFRKAALAAMKKAHDEKGDIDEWKVAKLAVDTAHVNLRALAVKQTGEVRAWGLEYVPDFSKLSDEQLKAMVKGNAP